MNLRGRFTQENCKRLVDRMGMKDEEFVVFSVRKDGTLNVSMLDCGNIGLAAETAYYVSIFQPGDYFDVFGCRGENTNKGKKLFTNLESCSILM